MKDNLSRIPQSFTFDTNVLERTFGSDATVLRDIIVYAANYKMRDLWGNVSFTLDEFSREMGYNRTFLQRTCEQFVDKKKNLPVIPGDTHPWTSVFEHALYRGMKENIIIKRKKGDSEIIESYQIIEKLEVHYDKDTQKKTKRTYTVHLADKLLNNLLTEYFLINYGDYTSLRSRKQSALGGYRNMYLFMARMIAQVRYNVKQGVQKKFVISVDELLKIFGNSEINRNDNKLRAVENTLREIQKTLPHTHFQWDFDKNGNRREYFVRFEFPDETLEAFDEKLKAVFMKKLVEACKWKYIENENPQMQPLGVVKAKKTLDMDKFANWFMSDNGITGKEKIFRKMYLEVYGFEYPEDREISFE